MAKRILVIDGDDRGHFFLSVDGQTLTIGDSPTHAEVVLRDLHIARIRCEVEVGEDLVVLGGTNGSGTRQELRPGAEAHIGHSHFRFEGEAAAPTLDDSPGFADEEPPDPDAPPAAPPAEASSLAAALYKRLMVVDGADQGRFFCLPESGTVTIGSSSKNADVVLHDLYVARIHCELAVGGDQCVVTHVEGQHGTLVNGQRIAKAQTIAMGDVIRVGNSHLRLELAVVEEEPAGKNDGEAAATGDEESFEVVEDDGSEGGEEIVVEEETSDGESHHLPHAPIDELVQLEDQVLGHYRVGPLLGRGHTGLVFQATDTKNKQDVTLKVLSPDFPADNAELQTFIKALKVLPTLPHPHLIALHGAGKTGAYCWMAREYVEGESITRLVRRLTESDKLDWSRACRVTIHLARALAACHAHKIVHGNITPRNVLVRSADKVTKLADLMLRPALAGSRLQQAVQEEKLLAEMSYLAPEQTEPDAFVDHLADLYGVGAVAYTLCTGQPPFNADTPEEIRTKVCESKVRKPSKYQPDMPAEFEFVLLKLLAKRQEDRYQSAKELLKDAEAIAEEFAVKV